MGLMLDSGNPCWNDKQVGATRFFSVPLTKNPGDRMSDCPINVILVDDHSLVRAGFRYLLQSEPDITVIGEAVSAEQAIPLAKSLKPHVLVLDITLPGMSGIDAIPWFQAYLPQPKILMLSMHDTSPFPEQALKRGADGYLAKSCAPEELVTAIRAVAQGRSYLSAQIAKRLASQTLHYNPVDALATLTPREFQIFALLASGLSVRDVADTVQLSPKTVHVHRASVLQKLEIHNPAELIQLALRIGVVKHEVIAHSDDCHSVYP